MLFRSHCSNADRILIEDRHRNCTMLFDEGRRIHYSKQGNDVENTIECIQAVHGVLPNARVVHSFIPEFAVPQDMDKILNYVSEHNLIYVKPFCKLDVGRDGYHYDRITAESFCQELIKLI